MNEKERKKEKKGKGKEERRKGGEERSERNARTNVLDEGMRDAF